MQSKDQMHPDDMRNLLIFAVISIVLWLAYDHFILKPKIEAMQAAEQQIALKADSENLSSAMARSLLSRDEAIAKNQSRRVAIENDLITGSLNLQGGRFDDVVLKQYYETVQRLNPVTLLSPKNTQYTKYIDYGWVSDNENLKLPNSQSLWRVKNGTKLTAQSPITLEWDNGQGVVFTRVITLNKDYGFTVEQIVHNKSARNIVVYPYGLISRRNIPKDFLGRFIIHEGPMIYAGTELSEKTYGKMKKDPSIIKQGDQGWAALTTKNWLTAIVPMQGEQTKFRMTYRSDEGDSALDRYQVDVMGAARTIASGEKMAYTSNLFVGAKKVDLLEKYEDSWNVPHFDLTVDFGMFYFLTRPFFELINFFYGFVGNFGVAIILFTICLRICVFPLANTSFKSFAGMKKLAPKMQELREKYSDDKAKMQQELVRLYQKEKVNPMAGCLPILVQIPIFFSLFKVLSNTIEMRHAPFFGWIEDLSAPDPTSFLNLFGLLPFTPPSFFMIGAWPCLMLLTMIIQRKLNPPPTDKMQAQLFALMPWIMTIVLAQFAAGLVIYWTFNNLFSTLQQYIIMRRMGVEVDLIGNIFGKKSVENDQDIGVEASEDKVSVVKGADQGVAPKTISKPKPKKSRKGKSKK